MQNTMQHRIKVSSLAFFIVFTIQWKVSWVAVLKIRVKKEPLQIDITMNRSVDISSVVQYCMFFFLSVLHFWMNKMNWRRKWKKNKKKKTKNSLYSDALLYASLMILNCIKPAECINMCRTTSNESNSKNKGTRNVGWALERIKSS